MSRYNIHKHIFNFRFLSRLKFNFSISLFFFSFQFKIFKNVLDAKVATLGIRLLESKIFNVLKISSNLVSKH